MFSKKTNHCNDSDEIFLGIDFGTKYIGIASGQKITGTASPLRSIAAKDGKPDWQNLDKIISEWKPAALIVGLPKHLDGTEHRLTRITRKFISALRKRYQMPIYDVNEQYTTKSAKEMIFDVGGYKALQKEDIDSIAAKYILESWLNNN